MWYNKINFKSCEDYVHITDSTGDKFICGVEREPYVDEFCSNVIYVSYIAVTPKPPFLNPYKGFTLFYESKPYNNNNLFLKI